MSSSDCGCWTDSTGYWHMSKKCLEAERESWRGIVGSGRQYAEDIRAGRKIGLTAHERAVAYFRQELRDNVE